MLIVNSDIQLHTTAVRNLVHMLRTKSMVNYAL